MINKKQIFPSVFYALLNFTAAGPHDILTLKPQKYALIYKLYW